MPDFEVLDAKIASALNRIIHNTQFEKKGQSGGNESSQRGSLCPRKTDRLLDLRVLPGHWSQRFCRVLCRPIYIVLGNDDIQEFDSHWDEILLSMTQIPSDEILEGWDKLRIRESEKAQDRIGIVQYGDSSEESRT